MWGNIGPTFGDPYEIRTLDTRFWRPLLYQLSYTPISLEVIPFGVIKNGGPSGTRTRDQPVMSRPL